jgi:3-hydroxybutyryl-CoA dehydrogenase
MSGSVIIGVVGLGAMGLGIAQVFASAGFSVVIWDAFAPARDGAKDRMAKALAARVTSGKLDAAKAEATLARITSVQDMTELATCGVVIEAIVEELAAKRALFAALESFLPPGALLATNTSSIPVRDIAQGLAHPQRCLALHFFNPAPAMALVELVPQADTSASALTLAREICQAAGKTVIQCADRPGFIVNRCARPFYGEALALLEEGRSAPEIDAALQAAGYRLGPFALIDLIGADINLAATEGLYAAMANHPRYHPFAALRAQVAKGDLGRKSGKGFVFPDPAVAPPPDAAAITLRIEACLINEAHWLLAEGGVSVAGIDTALRLGLNFPYGPFAALQAHGQRQILAELARLRATAPREMWARYAPAPGLESP